MWQVFSDLSIFFWSKSMLLISLDITKSMALIWRILCWIYFKLTMQTTEERPLTALRCLFYSLFTNFEHCSLQSLKQKGLESWTEITKTRSLNNRILKNHNPKKWNIGSYSKLNISTINLQLLFAHLLERFMFDLLDILFVHWKHVFHTYPWR